MVVAARTSKARRRRSANPCTRRRLRRAEGADRHHRPCTMPPARDAGRRALRPDRRAREQRIRARTFPEPVEEADLDGWRAVFDTNVFGTMALTQEVVPHMKRHQRGAIVMINTQATRKPFAGEGGYAVSKGRSRLRQNTARELGVHGIRANSIHMGWMWGVPTDVFPAGGCRVRHDGRAGHRADRVEHRAREAADRRRLRARCAVLASDYANAVTGATLDANGGDFMP